MAPFDKEQLYELIESNINDAIWLFSIEDFKVYFCTSSSQQVSGHTAEEIVGLPLETIYPPESIARINHEIAEALRQADHQQEVARSVEIQARHKNGSMIWLEISARLIRDEDGKPRDILGVSRNITERKKAEEAVRLSEQALRTILDNTHDAIFVHSVDGRILDVNQKMLDLYQVTREQALPLSIADDFSTPNNPLDKLAIWWEQVLAGETIVFEWQAKRPNDGTAFDVEVALSRITMGDNPVVLANVRDISSRKAAEAILKESEEKFRALAEHSMDTIMRFDRSHRNLYVNPIVHRETGIPAEEFVGKTHEELGFPEHLCSLWGEAIDRVFETAEVGRLEFQLPSGSWMDWMLMPELDEHEVKAVITSARDITDRKKAEAEKAILEEQLRQSQKLESVGRLAGGIAHDFNNILTGIIGYSEMILDDLDPSERSYSDIEEIIEASQRAASLTNQLLAFSRKQVSSPQVVRPGRILERSQKMLGRIIGEDVELVFVPPEDLGRIKVDPDQLDQILVNLAVNARDAMPDGGRMTIETMNTTLQAEDCAQYDGAEPGDYVVLVVSDTGHGMDQETRSKIFEPFFTTKGIERGTGLGLSTVYGILRQNDGFVSVYSESGVGTTFRIYFPRVTEEVELAKLTMDLPVGLETILLVEDEDMVRVLAKRILKRQGYEVLEAENGRSALRKSKRYEGGIDLLVTDVIMPQMSGKQLYQRLLETRPTLKALFVSGYTENVIAHDDGEIAFLRKPYSVSALADRVRKVIDS